MVIVIDDDTTALSASIAASKLGIQIVHIGAGCRNYDMMDTFEQNRRIIDNLSSYLFTPTESIKCNMNKEYLCGCIINYGDIDVDILPHIKNTNALENYIFTFIDNHTDIEQLSTILSALSKSKSNVIFSTTQQIDSMLKEHKLQEKFDGLIFISSSEYCDVINYIRQSKLVITDNDKIQKYAYLLKVPSLSLIRNNMWNDMINLNWNISIPFISEPSLLTAIHNSHIPKVYIDYFGNQGVSKKIVKALIEIDSI
jgi:UDP-N-acetylglucosamine 2-epimerase